MPIDNCQASPAAPPRRGRFDATVESNRVLCRDHHLLRLRVAGGAFPASLPGQFIQLGCRAPNGSLAADLLLGRELEWRPDRPPTPGQVDLVRRTALLRRPFSLAGRGDDAAGAWLEIVHRVVGVGTDWLWQLKPGDALDLIGPLGNAFALPDDKCLGLLVGGGVGLPPMFYLAQRLRQEGWDAVTFVGAVSRDLLAVDWAGDCDPDPTGIPKPSVRQFAQHGYASVVTTDDGSLGLTGRITAGLEQVLESLPPASVPRAVVFTCGPEPMMKAVARLAAARGVACQVCLEQAMACGMGTCQSCIVKIDPRFASRRASASGQATPPPPAAPPPQGRTADGRPWRYQLACTDGPVFDAADVVW